MNRIIDRYSKEELIAMQKKAVDAHTKKCYKLTQLAKSNKRLEEKITKNKSNIIKLENEIRQLAVDVYIYEQRLKEIEEEQKAV